MLNRSALLDGGHVRSIARAGWQWWLGELAGMLPRRVHAALVARNRPITVDMLDDEVVIASAAPAELRVAIPPQGADLGDSTMRSSRSEAAAKVTRRDAAVHLRLPPYQMLRRTVDLPRAAARNMRDILRFEVERLSPIGVADIVWDWRVISHAPAQGKIRVEVWLAKRGVMERAAQLCEALTLSPAAVGIIGEASSIPGARLLPPRRDLTARRLRRRAVPALLLLMLALAALLLFGEMARRQAEIDQLQARVEKARAGAQAAEGLRKDIQQVAGRVGFLAGRKQEPLVIAVLTEVTRRLPDDAWLVQFQLNEREVRIQGFAPKASAMIELFSQSQLFANAQFRAPVTRGPRGDIERFDLSFELRGRR